MFATCLLLQLLVANVQVNNLTLNQHLRKYIKTLCENKLVKEGLLLLSVSKFKKRITAKYQFFIKCAKR